MYNDNSVDNVIQQLDETLAYMDQWNAEAVALFAEDRHWVECGNCPLQM